MTVWEANVLSVQLMMAEELLQYYVNFKVHALKDGMDLATHECFSSQPTDKIRQTTYFAALVPIILSA